VSDGGGDKHPGPCATIRAKAEKTRDIRPESKTVMLKPRRPAGRQAKPASVGAPGARARVAGVASCSGRQSLGRRGAHAAPPDRRDDTGPKRC